MYKINSQSLTAILTAEKNNKGASFTVKSKRTGKDYTYKIKRSEYNGVWYTHIYVETNYLKFTHLGVYFNGIITKNKRVVDSPSAIAIAFVLHKASSKQFDYLNDNVDIMHLGSCIKCGKTLTDAQSIESGLGPICSNY
jgi:hypothetical protein